MNYNISDQDSDKVDVLLTENNIQYDKFYGPLAAFCKEESQWRVTMYEEEHDISLSNEAKDFVTDSLEIELNGNDYIVDGEYLGEFSNQVIERELDKFNSENNTQIQYNMIRAMIRIPQEVVL